MGFDMKRILRVARVPLRLSALLVMSVLVIDDAAALITPYANRAAFDATFPGSIYEPWDSYANGTTFPNGSTTNGITYQTNSTQSVVTNVFRVTTSPNGLGLTDPGFFTSVDSVTFTFDVPLMAFGIDVNTFANNAGAYTATLNLGDVIPSVFDAFPGFNTGEFIGFESDIAFSSVTIAAAQTNLTYTLDTLRRVVATPVSVPEPSSVALLLLVLTQLWLSLRRTRRGESHTGPSSR